MADKKIQDFVVLEDAENDDLILVSSRNTTYTMKVKVLKDAVQGDADRAEAAALEAKGLIQAAKDAVDEAHERAITAAEEANTAADLAMEQAGAAQSAAEAANTAAQGISAAVQEAENAAQSAQGQAQAAQNAASAAQAAAQTASTAATLANSAKSEADTAAQNALTQGNYAKTQGDRAAQLVDEIEETDVGGMAADILELQTDLDGHAGNQNNPHGVTAAQINAVPITRYINGKDLASDITLTPGDVGAVPTSRTINGKTLSSNINLTPTDIGVTAKRTCRFVVGTSTNGWTQDDCDYLCDGVDDQVEIQAAIDALPALGGEIVILRGDYHMTDNLILKDNVAIRGELNYWPNSQINYASRVTLQKQGSARKIIKGADKVVLENIFTIMYELNFANSCQAIIRNCNMWITGKLTNTLIENSSGNLTFENLTYSSIVNHNGSIFISSGDNVNIDGGQNILGNSGSISLNGVSNSIVSNIVYENASYNGPIITIAGGSHNNIIIGNIINKNYEDAMWNQFGAIYVYGNAYNNLICGNKLKVREVANAHSILFDSSTHDNIVMGNSFIKYNYSNAGTNNQFINNFVYDEVTST